MAQGEPVVGRYRVRSTARLVASAALAITVYYLVPVGTATGVELTVRATLVTFGFGDVHAVGQLARILVIVQMLSTSW